MTLFTAKCMPKSATLACLCTQVNHLLTLLPISLRLNLSSLGYIFFLFSLYLIVLRQLPAPIPSSAPTSLPTSLPTPVNMPPLLDKATPESRLILRSVLCVCLGLILFFFHFCRCKLRSPRRSPRRCQRSCPRRCPRRLYRSIPPLRRHRFRRW